MQAEPVAAEKALLFKARFDTRIPGSVKLLLTRGFFHGFTQWARVEEVAVVASAEQNQ